MKPVSIKLNILANYAAQAWTALMGLAFVPLYIKYLGIEAYGLMGVFVLLQALLPLLDLGMSPALSREMARFRAGGLSVQGIRDLLRTIEFVFAGLALVVGAVLWTLSGWLASSWLNVGRLGVPEVEHAVAIMGFVVALRFFESVYRSSLMGLQRQVVLSVANTVLATVRSVGAVGILVWVSPSISAFFWWQAVVSVLTTIVLVAMLYRSLPTPTRGRFSTRALIEVRGFAGGMAGISILSFLLTQVDKVLLSRLLPLDQYGYYMLATNVATLLYTIVTPISQAYYPRFCELLARGEHRELAANYHKAAQLVSVAGGAVAFMLIAFGELALHTWTRNATLAHEVAPLLAVLTLGIFLNCLMWIPYQMQLAHGMVGLALRTNIVAIVFVIPAIFWAIPRFGPIGAAWVWVVLNGFYLIVTANLMYRRIIGQERWHWYFGDLVRPLLALTSVGLLCRLAMPSQPGRLQEFGLLALTTAFVVAAAVLAAPRIRLQVLQRRQPLLSRQTITPEP